MKVKNSIIFNVHEEKFILHHFNFTIIFILKIEKWRHNHIDILVQNLQSDISIGFRFNNGMFHLVEGIE